MLDKDKLKKKLEAEKERIEAQLADMGKLNAETNEWEAIPEDQDVPEADQNDMADRFEDFESRSSMIEVLQGRLNSILLALSNINKKSFGTCEVCGKDIEIARLEANPAATTCKKHLNE